MSNSNVCILAKVGMRFIYGIVFCYACLFSLFTAQTIERAMLPVVTNFSITQIEHKKDRLLIQGNFNKVRDCQFVEVVAYSGNKLLDVTYQDYPIARSRSEGTQEFGPWKITPNTYTLRLEAHHRCHLLWNSSTTLLKELKL